MKTQFHITVTNEFGTGATERAGKILDTAEKTFRAFLKSMPKFLSKQWQIIEFEFDGKLIEVSKEMLVETNWDFDNSIQVAS